MPQNSKVTYRHLIIGLVAVLLFVVTGPIRTLLTSGATLGSRSLQISDSRVSVPANYILTFNGQTAGTVGSVRAQFCANDPLIGLPCVAPNGFDVSNATLANQSGMGGFSISPSTTSNVLILTRAPGVSIVGNSSFTMTNVLNPDQPGSYFVRLETYASSDASGTHTDYGGLAFSIGADIAISATVPPYLLFCVATTMPDLNCDTASGDFIDFGEFGSSRTATGQTKLLIATNGDNGYAIRVFGTTLTSGNNVIPAIAAGDFSRQGTSQFGLNLTANGTPATGTVAQGPGNGIVSNGYATSDSYRFVSGDVIATALSADDLRRYTASYIVNISKAQPSGVYVSTLTYISLANF